MMRMHYSTNVGSNGSHPTSLDPFDQFGDPTDGDLSDSGSATAHRTASGTMVTTPHATAAAAPAVYATATLTQVLYLQEAGNTSLIAVSDINQGQIGDCFLLSSIGELALWHTSAITNMIHANANGTETVTLYLAANGQLPTFGTTSFKATSVTIDNTFPSNAVNSGATQDVLNGQKEIWVQVLEKAVATLEGGYGAISYGGYPVVAMEELTGQPATWMSPASLTLSQLQSFMAAGDLIVMDTPGSGTLPYGLFNDHAYMFESLTMVSGTAMVQLVNPWGFDEPTAIPLASLATGIVEVDVGRFVASTPIIGGPGNDTIILPSAVTNASIDLGAGNDTLAFANGTNSATVANTETIIGGTGNDTITLATAAANASVDLGAGSDKLTLANATNSATVANVETLVGGTGNDTITLGSVLTAAMSVDLGAGSNRLTLAAGVNTGTVSNVSTLIGGAGNDAVTLGTAARQCQRRSRRRQRQADTGERHQHRDGGKRRDPRWRHRQRRHHAGQRADRRHVGGPRRRQQHADPGERHELGHGRQHRDHHRRNRQRYDHPGYSRRQCQRRSRRRQRQADTGERHQLGDGGKCRNPRWRHRQRHHHAGQRADRRHVGGPWRRQQQTDPGGRRRYGLVSNVNTLIGGAGNDAVTLGTAAANASIDLGAGSDKLTLANATNTAAVANVETLVGGTGNDTITLATAADQCQRRSRRRQRQADPGERHQHGDGRQTSRPSIGGTGNDAITLGSALTAAHVGRSRRRQQQADAGATAPTPARSATSRP